MKEELESIAEELEDIASDLDYGSISRNDVVKRLYDAATSLKELEVESDTND